MKTLFRPGFCCLALLLTSACALVNNPHTEPPKPAPQVQAVKPLSGEYAVSGDCRAQAENRLALIDKPSTYPLSEQEKNNALIALYSECSHEHQTIAMDSGAQDAARFAALAPAAGGNMRSPYYASTAGVTATPGVMVIRGNDASQFAALSPASGGLPAEAYAAVPPGAYANAFGGNAASPSVVVVESPGAMPIPVAARPPVVAMPVPPLATAYAPVTRPSMPRTAQAEVRQPSSLKETAASKPLPAVASAAPAKGLPTPPPVRTRSLDGSNPQQLEDVLLKN
jgi:hypothetical protein